MDDRRFKLVRVRKDVHGQPYRLEGQFLTIERSARECWLRASRRLPQARGRFFDNALLVGKLAACRTARFRVATTPPFRDKVPNTEMSGFSALLQQSASNRETPGDAVASIMRSDLAIIGGVRNDFDGP